MSSSVDSAATLNQLRLSLLAFICQFVRNIALKFSAASLFIPVDRLHLDEIDNPPELIFGTNGHLRIPRWIPGDFGI